MICYPLKYTMIGDCAVGKSQLSLRFCRDMYIETHTSTTSMQFMSYDIILGSFLIRAQLWDLNGDVRVPELSKAFLAGAIGCAAVYDISCRESFENLLNKWIPQVRRYLGDDIAITLIGNKVDLSNDSREVTTIEAIEYAKSQNFDFIEVSALDNINIDIAFRRMIIKAAFSIPDINSMLASMGLPLGWCRVALNENDENFLYCNYWTNEIIYNQNFTPKYASYIPREFRQIGTIKPVPPIAYLGIENDYVEDSPPIITTATTTVPNKEFLHEELRCESNPKSLQTATTVDSLKYQTTFSQCEDCTISTNNNKCIPSSSCVIC